MSGNMNPTNKKLEELVEKAGVGKHVLEDPERVVCDDVWTEERERLAREHLSQDKSSIPEFWQKKYEKEAAKSWDKFYKRNSTNFYKDRHYLHLVFKDLGVVPEAGETRTLLEVGSGVGNAALPLLEINPALNIVAIDFADSAIELLKKQPLYDEARVAASVCDITNDALPDAAFANGGVDFALFLFCLSALHPDKMKDAVKKIVAAIKPGGKLFFRDYGRYDQAQLRFRPGCKLQENFYVRQDNTRAYYFTTEEVEELFTQAGLVCVENEYIRRQYANRQQNVVRFRVWVHASKGRTMSDALYASVKQDDLECNDGTASRVFSRGPDYDERRALVKKFVLAALVVMPYLVLIALFAGVGSPRSNTPVIAVSDLANQTQVDQVCADQRLQKLDMQRNVYYDSSLLSRPQRYAALQQKGATLWFTGLSGSGKSTVGRALEKELLRRRVHTYRLDGDNVRIGLNRDLGFSETDRAESVRRVGEMSTLFSEAGVITLVALVSPYRARRDEVRDLHKKMNIPFYEVFVDVPVSVAADRDVKGLYKRAIKGEIKDFTGISSPYEEPLTPEIHLNASSQSLDDEVKMILDKLEADGLLTGVEEPPSGYPGVAVADGGNAVATFPTLFPDQPRASRPDNYDALPRVLLRDEDVHWLQVIGEGWAAPLRGFMREGVYLQSLHFSSVLYDTDNLTDGHLALHKSTNFSEYSNEFVSKGQRVNMPVPIVLPINDATKDHIGEFKQVVLVSPSGEELALLNDPEVYDHRKEERITRTFGAMDDGHPYIAEILKSGEYLLGGEIELLTRVKYNDDLDQYRLTPTELRKRFKEMNADVVLAFQTRNPTHAGHAYLMNNAREQLIAQGYKNPVLWLSPLGGWTKEDDVPLDVRVRQHEAILRDGMLDKESTVLAIWPSPMIYAGPREVQWHAKSRKNAGASFFVVGRDPAGIKRSDGDKDDIYAGDHGRFVLHMAPGMEDFNILSFSKVYYDVQDHKMKPMDSSRKQDFLSISGSRMRKMAREGLQKCEGDKIPTGWEDKPTCVPQGFMVKSGWDIMIDYYQNINSPRWIPFATQFSKPVVDTSRSFSSEGTFGRTDYKLHFKNEKGEKISPWHDIPLHPTDSKDNSSYNFIVEIPKGIAHKMEVNKEERYNPIMQDTTHNGTRGRDYLYGVPFFNYGLLPQTWEDPSVKDENGNGGDNDPLDVIEIGAKQLRMGSVNPVKILGSLELVDQGEVDHKILVISLADEDADKINSVSDLQSVKPGVLDALVDWLKKYKIPEGKSENVFSQEKPTSAEAAIQIVAETHERWKKLKAGEISTKDEFWLN